MSGAVDTVKSGVSKAAGNNLLAAVIIALTVASSEMLYVYFSRNSPKLRKLFPAKLIFHHMLMVLRIFRTVDKKKESELMLGYVGLYFVTTEVGKCIYSAIYPKGSADASQSGSRDKYIKRGIAFATTFSVNFLVFPVLFPPIKCVITFFSGIMSPVAKLVFSPFKNSENNASTTTGAK